MVIVILLMILRVVAKGSNAGKSAINEEHTDCQWYQIYLQLNIKVPVVFDQIVRTVSGIELRNTTSPICTDL